MIPSRSDYTLWSYATLCTPPKRRGASMQGGHHLHTYTTSTSRGVSYGECSSNGCRISQLYPLINDLRCTVSGVGASENPMKLKENTLVSQIS